MVKVGFALCGAVLLTGCNSVSIPGATGERELRPPRAGIQIGSLYYVREKPTADLSAPANLERLCSVNLATYGITPSDGQVVADIDLLRKYDLSGGLDGIKNEFVSLGLSGSFSDYFEYKLTNVKRFDISYDEAQRIYSNRAFRNDCTSWRGNINGNDWGIYQIQSISIGDIAYSRKPLNASLDANASAKIAQFEPRLRLSLQRAAQIGFTGAGVVATFGPIMRN